MVRLSRTFLQSAPKGTKVFGFFFSKKEPLALLVTGQNLRRLVFYLRPETLTGDQQGKQFFFRKRTKKILFLLDARCRNLRDSRTKSCLLLFFKKAGLAYFPHAGAKNTIAVRLLMVLPPNGLCHRPFEHASVQSQAAADVSGRITCATDIGRVGTVATFSVQVRQ